ncbi:MAG: MmgE/PrpD family protein [Betaproteobacteria bacterium]|nr:MmgE/PrpD family protein [Betaproteobacteria bacterium]
METEKKLAEYVSQTRFEDLPRQSVQIIKNVLLTVLGTTIAGASADGCQALVDQVREWGGKGEASILVYGGKAPAHAAALANSTMARALDYCDAMVPGMHVGSSSVPTALAMAELAGGCSGKEFLAALVVGTELAARINAVSIYDGFDPTGVCSVFAATVIAGRLLRLDPKQMLDALALAYNKAGGSFQSNIDGSLAVRVIQGFVSQAGITCAQLAARGITGPKNFLEGIYGYFHLYAKDRFNAEALTQGLGKSFEMDQTLFKKYPSCGCTLAATDAILELAEEKALVPQDIEAIHIKVPPYNYKLTGAQFEIGENPKVSAQFSIQYCVANALLRKSAKLHHFDEACVREPSVMALARMVRISPDPGMADADRPGFSLAARLDATIKSGHTYYKAVDVPRGAPGNPMTQEEHMERFRDCVNYANKCGFTVNPEKIISMIAGLEAVADVRSLIPLLSPQQAGGGVCLA